MVLKASANRNYDFVSSFASHLKYNKFNFRAPSIWKQKNWELELFLPERALDPRPILLTFSFTPIDEHLPFISSPSPWLSNIPHPTSHYGHTSSEMARNKPRSPTITSLHLHFTLRIVEECGFVCWVTLAALSGVALKVWTKPTRNQ